VAAFADEQRTEVGQAFEFCLAVVLGEKGEARLVNTSEVQGRTYYRYETVAGDVFSVVGPETGAEGEGQVREWVARVINVRHVGGHAAPYDPAQGGLAPLTPNVVELGRQGVCWGVDEEDWNG